jgi:hypothetical protein
VVIGNVRAVEYTKACRCVGVSATVGRTIYYDATGKKNVFDAVRAIHYPGPICDKCEVPWNEEYL